MFYAYGIIESGYTVDISDKIGFGDGLSLIKYSDIAAVISEVGEEFSQETVDKNIKDMKWVSKNAPVHEQVVEKIMDKTAIIPFKFCTIFSSRENVEKMLEKNYSNFRENLKRVEGRVEIGVKVYFNPEQLQNEIMTDEPEVKNLEKEMSKHGSGAAYFTEQKIRKLVRDATQKKLLAQSREIFITIKALADDGCENDLWSKKITKKDMMLNSAFLIKRSDIINFKDSVEKIAESYKEFEFQLSGPFPPYNFVG